MKKYKNIILIITIIAIWCGLILMFSKEKIQLETEKAPQILIINNTFFWKYESGEWNSLNATKDYKQFNWKDFDMYLDNEFYGTYKFVSTNGKAYFYNDDKSIDITHINMLINHDSFFKVVNYDEDKFDNKDNNIVSKFLNKNKINFEEVTYKKKYIISEDDTIYVTTNYYDGINIDEIYYIVFYRKNNKNYLIVKENYNYNFDLYGIIDINKTFHNFILKYSCSDSICYEMFQYNGKEYKNVTEN